MPRKILIFLTKIVLFATFFCIGFSSSSDGSYFAEDRCSDLEVAEQCFPYETLNGEDFQKNLCELKEFYGEGFYNDITRISAVQSTRLENSPEHKINFLQLENLKNFSTLKSAQIEKLKELLDEYFCLYPSSWTANVEDLIFESQNKQLASIKNPNPSDLVAGTAACNGACRWWTIRIYPATIDMSRDLNPEIFGDIISHELSHTIDWSSINATPEQKLEFFKKTADRFNSSDHYCKRDNYLNKINIGTPEQTAYRKVLEYWAVIASTYLENEKTLPQQDAELVNSIIKYTDPQMMDWRENAELRQKIVNKILW